MEGINLINNFLIVKLFIRLDGIITTFSVVVGAYSSNLGLGVMVTLGASILFSDAVAMALGDYLSTKSEVLNLF